MNQTVALDELNQIVDKALCNLGIKNPERDIIREVLMYAEMRGSSQGLIKIKERTVLPDKNCTDIKIENKMPSICRIDGGGHTGMYVLHTATTVAAECVRTNGIALVSTHNTRSSTGAIGFYANHLAQSGYIGMVLAGSPKVMAMEGGIDPVFGTNPIAIAIPTKTQPLVLDMATAATTWFAVISARDNNEKLPLDSALDANGQPTVSPIEAMSGALKTFGGAKGSGLALMFEFLTGVLGNASLFGDSEDNRSNTVIAIDPSAIDDGFTDRASQLVARLKSSRAHSANIQGDKNKPVNNTIRLPGEQSNARATKRQAKNKIPIDGVLLDHLTELADH